MEINVVDPFARKGYRFKGTAQILTDGPQFDAVLAFYRARGTQSIIRAIVLVVIESAAPLVSPAYDDGTTEATIRTRWQRHYAGLGDRYTQEAADLSSEPLMP